VIILSPGSPGNLLYPTKLQLIENQVRQLVPGGLVPNVRFFSVDYDKSAKGQTAGQVLLQYDPFEARIKPPPNTAAARIWFMGIRRTPDMTWEPLLSQRPPPPVDLPPGPLAPQGRRRDVTNIPDCISPTPSAPTTFQTSTTTSVNLSAIGSILAGGVGNLGSLATAHPTSSQTPTTTSVNLSAIGSLLAGGIGNLGSLVTALPTSSVAIAPASITQKASAASSSPCCSAITFQLTGTSII
jgi:hypothetical protein